MRTRACTAATISGRLTKARSFADAADLLAQDEQFGDVYVTNCILAQDAGRLWIRICLE